MLVETALPVMLLTAVLLRVPYEDQLFNLPAGGPRNRAQISLIVAAGSGLSAAQALRRNVWSSNSLRKQKPHSPLAERLQCLKT